jgi:hypothetical protein
VIATGRSAAKLAQLQTEAADLAGSLAWHVLVVHRIAMCSLLGCAGLVACSIDRCGRLRRDGITVASAPWR